MKCVICGKDVFDDVFCESCRAEMTFILMQSVLSIYSPDSPPTSLNHIYFPPVARNRIEDLMDEARADCRDNHEAMMARQEILGKLRAK